MRPGAREESDQSTLVQLVGGGPVGFGALLGGLNLLGIERLPTKRMRGVRALQRAMVTRMIIMSMIERLREIEGGRGGKVGNFRVVRK